VGHVSKVSSRLADQGATLRRLAAGTRRRPRLGARRGGPQCARVAGSIVRKTTFGTGALTGVLFADRLDGSRFCSPFRSRAAD